jgi:hypothetical protein
VRFHNTKPGAPPLPPLVMPEVRAAWGTAQRIANWKQAAVREWNLVRMAADGRAVELYKFKVVPAEELPDNAIGRER